MRNSDTVETANIANSPLNVDGAIKPEATLVVSCVFGTGFSKLWPAQKDFRCILFSNNPKMEVESRKKGWEYVFVDKFNLSSDKTTSSVQAKYVKFLQFLRDFPEYRGYRRYIYYDHAILLPNKELKRLISLVKSDRSIFMMSSRRGFSAADQLKAASMMPRYKQAEERTIRWVNKKVEHEGATWDSQVFATGFIIFQNISIIMPILDEVYDTVVELRQPMCQILWAIVIKKHYRHLQSLHWTETSMVKRTPLPLHQAALRSCRSLLKEFAVHTFYLFNADYEKFRRRYILKLFGAGIR